MKANLGMSGFGILHLRRIADRPVRLLMAVAGIAAGVALVVSILGLYTSILHSVDRLQTLAGTADLELSASGGNGVDLDHVLSALDRPEVAAMAPLVRTSVAVDGEVVLLIGADARSLPFAGELARQFGSAANDVSDGLIATPTMAETLGTSGGDKVAVYSPSGGERVVDVDGVVGSGELTSVNGGRLVFAAFDIAQDLLGRSTVVDSVLVDLADGSDVAAVRDELRDVVGPAVLVEERSDRRDRITAPAITYLSQVGPVAGMALVVGGFLVFNTMNMAAMERRREIATLRMLGATRRRLIAGLLGEAAVIGFVGSVAGIVLGRLGAVAVVGALPAAMAQAIGVEVSFSLPGALLALALAIGVGAAVVATLVPAIRATGDHPLTILHPTGGMAGGGEPTGVAWLPFVAGVGMMLAGTAVVATVQGDQAAGGILLLTVGGIVASYGAADPLARTAARIAQFGGGLGHLAASGLRRSPHRIWATSMAVALAVAMTLAVASGARNQLDVNEVNLASLKDSDLVVAPWSLDRWSSDMYLPDDLPVALLDIHGIEATTAMVNVEATRDGKGFLVYGADAQPGPSSLPLLELASPHAQAAALQGDAALVSDQFARTFGVREGDHLDLAGTSGSVTLPVAQVVPNTLSLSPNGMIAINAGHVREVFGLTAWSTIEVELAPGADPALVRDRIVQHAEAVVYPMVVSTGQEAYDDVLGAIAGAIGMMYLILVVIVIIAGLAVLNTLVASILDRWRELGVLRAVGTTPRQLARVIGLEATGIGIVGTAVGIVVGAWVHWAGIRYVGNASPLPAVYKFEPTIVAVAAAAGVAATVIGTLTPVRRATRVDVLDAIAWE